MAFKRVIFPFIKFKTKECQELLEEMKKVVVYSTSKKLLKKYLINILNLNILKLIMILVGLK